MKLTQAFLLALPALSAAHPGMSNADVQEYIRKRKVEESTLEERQLLSGLIGTVGALTNTVTGLLGAVASSVSPDNKRPEPGYEFKAPGPGDSRGPCPGMNLLANYGYIPRNGHVTLQQTIEASARGFNMGVDIATILGTIAVLTDGDIATESYYIGSLTGTDGLNRHSTSEADISPNREDYYNGCGDNHHLSSRLFKQNVALAAADPTKQFTMGVMAQQYAANSKFSQANNPYLYFVPFPQIVSLGAYAFYPNYLSNGTYGNGGVANYESISSIVGAKYDSSTGNFKYVPERWPENWYRRATPYGAVEAVTDAYTKIYTANIILPVDVAQLTTQVILCNIYQGINSALPLFATGALGDTSKLLTFVTGKLLPILGADTIIGCPDGAVSPTNSTLFPNADQVGGPQNLPSASSAKTGNNVYNKVYFESAPVKPTC
jgi:hypothetical protein